MKDSVVVNIVSFNTPYPPDFGGSIDVFYKIKALSALGIRIYLHCFTYGNHRPQPELEKYCEKVFYYPRRKGLFYFFSILPYIVSTRNSRDLLKNLIKSGAPVIFEGLHTCRWVSHPDLAGTRKIIRMHNIEHNYYSELSKASGNPFKKLYYSMESDKLKRFEKIASHTDFIAAISPADQYYFEARFKKSVLIPAFHQHEMMTSKAGKGSYFLYHGNLSVEENMKAVEFLCKKVFSDLDIKLVIAGKNPPGKLIRLPEKYQNISIRINPTDDEMLQLIGDAQGCILPTFQATGLKLKLLGSLFAGRFCIVNKNMVSGTGLEDLCLIAETPEEFRKVLQNTRNLRFSEEEKIRREKVLYHHFSNTTNAKRMINIIGK